MKTLAIIFSFYINILVNVTPFSIPIKLLYQDTTQNIIDNLHLDLLPSASNSSFITNKSQKLAGEGKIYHSRKYDHFRRISSIELFRNNIYTFSLLSKRQTLLPHFSYSMHSLGKSIICTLDIQPKVDLYADPEYVNKYYDTFIPIKNALNKCNVLYPLEISNSYIRASRSFIAMDVNVNTDDVSALKPFIITYINTYIQLCKNEMISKTYDSSSKNAYDRDAYIQFLQMENAPGRKIMKNLYNDEMIRKIDYITYGYNKHVKY